MKRIISLLLAVILVLSILPTAAFADTAPNVTLEANKTEVTKGEEIELTLSIDKTIEDAYIWQWNIIWNTDLFEAVKMQRGTAYNKAATNINATVTMPAPYKASSVTSGNSLALHTLKAGSLCVLTLKAKADITADSNTKFYVFKSAVQTGVEEEDESGNWITKGTDYATVTQYDWGSSTAVTPAEDAPSLGVSVKAETTVAVAGVTLDKETLALTVGEIAALTATVTPEEASNKAVTWSAAPDGIVSVENGTVTALAAGTATVTVTTVDGSYTATCAVTVQAPAPEEAGYTVAMPADDSIVAGETVTVAPVVDYNDITPDDETDDVSTYNAFDMTFTYDASVLELTTKKIEGATVTAGEGTVRVQGYGADRNVGTAPFSLTFEGIAAGSGNVVATEEVYVDISGNAISENAARAILLKNTTVITVSGYEVDLPENFTGPNASEEKPGGDLVANPDKSYTFTAPEDHFDYTVKVYVILDGEKVDITEHVTADGLAYTIPAEQIDGLITVETEKNGKLYGITLGTGLNHYDEENTTVEENGVKKAQYMRDYKAQLTKRTGYSYEVSVTVGGETYDADVDEDIYTVKGEDITGDIVFSVTETLIPAGKYTITFQGTGRDAAPENTEAEPDSQYAFQLNKAEGYSYTVSYTMGDSADSEDLDEQDGWYTIAKVTGNVVITVDKTAELNVTVEPYLEADSNTVFLVTVNGTLDEGKAYIYRESDEADARTLFYSEPYEAWCFLLNVTGEAPNAEDVRAKISSTETTFTTLTATTDVNMTGKTDINDAQLVYDFYNAKYTDFTAGNMMQKFLNGDVNTDGIVNVNDAVAVIAAINASATTE